ncbi:aspartic peptidase domain-containing protein [Exophiala viscosa]|uniref:Aspartic peptidase domain-containing protein n=1 Tax=Exophiala viscosa TaxID=2486360 RepID=A0AAN6DZS9_9EURO|nr:aspartic peptidase domain-containing protein [Exophiala viscosa]
MRDSKSILARPCPLSSYRSLLLVAGLLPQFALASSQSPQPIVASTNTDFLGYDGSWSTVSIRVGSPDQWLDVLPSTISQETWVIGPAGCDNTTTCQNKRGGLFAAMASTTWVAEGLYELDFDTRLGDQGYGYYGLDTIALGDTTSVTEQIIAVVNSTDEWIGNLGLGVQDTRFSGSENNLPFLSSLVENGSYIPSHSYGYTAGASYRLKGVPASLVFGGVDANKFIPNSATFSLTSNYSPVLAINEIIVSSSASNGGSLPSNWDANPVSLLQASQAGSNLYTIDSSTPFLWLPESACDAFASALNLTYDDNLQLYLFSNDSFSSPDLLASWNLTFTFALSDTTGSSDVIQLTLPYDAFNLQLSYPFPNLAANSSSPATNYFPLRKAANSTQYTIGRAFLQETYLTVDYERNNFSISQAIFTEEAVNNVNLLAITRPSSSIFPGPKTGSSGITAGQAAGIGVSSAMTVLLVAALIWWLCFKRKRSKKTTTSEKPMKRSLFARLHRAPQSKTSFSELLGDRRQPTEVPADASATRYEMSGDTPIEMPADPVSPRYLATSADSEQRTSGLLRNNPRRLVELENQDSSAKAAEAAASDRSVSPVPPYSPAEISDNHFSSSGVSPHSVQHSPGFGTASSGEQGISPIAANSQRNSRQLSSGFGVPSPISPQATSTAPQHATQLSSDSPSMNTNRNSLMIPQLNGRPPSRSPSTGSRFVEEGLTTVADDRQPTSALRPASQGRRFSWEQ